MPSPDPKAPTCDGLLLTSKMFQPDHNLESSPLTIHNERSAPSLLGDMMGVEQLSLLDDENTRYIQNIETGSQEDKAFGCLFGLQIAWYCGRKVGAEKKKKKMKVSR